MKIVSLISAVITFCRLRLVKPNKLVKWALLEIVVLHVDEWLEVMREVGYAGDYYFSSATAMKLIHGKKVVVVYICGGILKNKGLSSDRSQN